MTRMQRYFKITRKHQAINLFKQNKDTYTLANLEN